jgi:hypothetical protein
LFRFRPQCRPHRFPRSSRSPPRVTTFVKAARHGARRAACAPSPPGRTGRRRSSRGHIRSSERTRAWGFRAESPTIGRSGLHVQPDLGFPSRETRASGERRPHPAVTAGSLRAAACPRRMRSPPPANPLPRLGSPVASSEVSLRRRLVLPAAPGPHRNPSPSLLGPPASGVAGSRELVPRAPPLGRASIATSLGGW